MLTAVTCQFFSAAVSSTFCRTDNPRVGRERGEPGFSCAMASFHPPDSLCGCLEPGWRQSHESAAELERAANSSTSHPNSAGLELMTPAFSVLAQMTPGLIFPCTQQISLVDRALLWDTDKNSNSRLSVCHYPNNLISLSRSFLLISDLLRVCASRVRDTLSNHSTLSHSASFSPGSISSGNHHF